MTLPWTTDNTEDWLTMVTQTWLTESLDGPVVNYYVVAADYFVAAAVGDNFVAQAVEGQVQQT